MKNEIFHSSEIRDFLSVRFAVSSLRCQSAVAVSGASPELMGVEK